jgi:hypothetical protein
MCVTLAVLRVIQVVLSEGIIYRGRFVFLALDQGSPTYGPRSSLLCPQIKFRTAYNFNFVP